MKSLTASILDTLGIFTLLSAIGYIVLLLSGIVVPLSCNAVETIEQPKLIGGYEEQEATEFIEKSLDVRIGKLKDDYIVAWDVPENIWELNIQLAVDFAASIMDSSGYDIQKLKGYGLWREEEATTISVFFVAEQTTKKDQHLKTDGTD